MKFFYIYMVFSLMILVNGSNWMLQFSCLLCVIGLRFSLIAVQLSFTLLVKIDIQLYGILIMLVHITINQYLLCFMFLS